MSIENGKYPAAMMVKELIPNVLTGRKWIYQDSPVMATSEEDAQKYDDTSEKMEKGEMIVNVMFLICIKWENQYLLWRKSGI